MSGLARLDEDDKGEPLGRSRLLDLLDAIAMLDDQALMFVLTAAQHVRDERNDLEAVVVLAPGWHPWSELRRRRHIDLAWADFPRPARGVYAWSAADDLGVIMLATWLSWAQMDHTLTHELIHDERRIPTMGAGIDPDDARTEEAIVKTITAERMDHAAIVNGSAVSSG